MKYPIILLTLALRVCQAELTYTITGTQNETTINPSDILLEPVEPNLDRLSETFAAAEKPAFRPRGSSSSRNVVDKRAVQYSSNWCGAVQHSPTANKITNVHAVFQVPTLSPRPSTSFPQYIATWVGIDGVTWGSALLQSGVTSQLSSSGVQTNWAWLEWIPDAAYNIPSFPVSTGDWIEVTVTAPSATAGNIIIDNNTKGNHLNISLTGGAALGRQDADWIVEMPATSSGYVPLARFSDIWIEDVVANTANGSVKDVNGAVMYQLSGNKCTSQQYDGQNFWAASS